MEARELPLEMDLFEFIRQRELSRRSGRMAALSLGEIRVSAEAAHLRGKDSSILSLTHLHSQPNGRMEA